MAAGTERTTTCPGCGLVLPAGERSYDRKFHASAECWAVYEDVLAAEYADAPLFGRVHQLTVDAWSVQHAGGRHPDKSVCIHLVGLHLVLERDVPPVRVPPLFRDLARRGSWPRLDPPAARAPLTVLDVARATSPDEHARRVRAWAEAVWSVWEPHHGTARRLADEILARADRPSGGS